MKASKKAWLAVLLVALSLYGCTPQTPAESTDDGVPVSTVNPAELFSFRYAGEASTDFLSEWLYEETTGETEAGQKQTCTWTDESTGLRVALELTHRQSEQAIEWVARLENTGSADTALIEALHIADFCLTDDLKPTETVKLCYSKGTDVSESDFLFQEEELPVGRIRAFQPSGGRSSSGDVMPYFNLCTETGGVLIAIGWTGQWQAVFERRETDVRVTAGMETTHFVLHPRRIRSNAVRGGAELAGDGGAELSAVATVYAETPHAARCERRTDCPAADTGCMGRRLGGTASEYPAIPEQQRI